MAVDRSDRVKAGDMLATVASVETDQLYEEAASVISTISGRCGGARKELAARSYTSQQAADDADRFQGDSALAQNEATPSDEPSERRSTAW